MSRTIGSGKYYTLNFTIERQALQTQTGDAGQRLTFPTAPMYHDKESYAGRNRVWLKSVLFGHADTVLLVDDVRTSSTHLKLELGTPSMNSYALECFPQNAVGIDTDNSLITNNTANRARFIIDPKINVDYGELAHYGLYVIAGGAGNLNNGDSQQVRAGLGVGLAQGRVDGAGNDIGLSAIHTGCVGSPSNAIEVGNVWGSTIDARLVMFSCLPARDVGAGVSGEGRTWDDQEGTIHLEIVVEPLINEHIPKHFGIEDEKNRNKF